MLRGMKTSRALAGVAVLVSVFTTTGANDKLGAAFPCPHGAQHAWNDGVMIFIPKKLCHTHPLFGKLHR